MAKVHTWLGRHRKLVFVLALALLTPLFVANAIHGETTMYVAANAPQNGSDLLVLVGVDPGLRDSCDGFATVEIELDGIIVYPSVFDKIALPNCQGTLAIPYAKFVTANAQYLVRAHWNGHVSETFVYVEKYVNWVFVRSFSEPKEGRARVDIALDSIKGQPLSSGVFANGTLVLDIRWEACAASRLVGITLPITDPTEPCTANGDLVFHAEVPVVNRASTILFIPYEALENDKWDEGRAEEGWYNVTATFHNDAAKGNYNVPMDPLVYQEDPPGNWFEVAYE